MKDVAFGRLGEFARGSVSRRRLGFTLIELMVVMGIIVVLLAILLPVVSKARESGRRTKCTGNLHNMGAACAAFANSNGGRFPMCYRMRDTITSPLCYPYYIPFCISQGDTGAARAGRGDTESNDTNVLYWPVYGTSWGVWQQYGVALDTLTCPSSLTTASLANLSTLAGGGGEQWGDIVWSDYMYVGGCSSAVFHQAPNGTIPYSSQSMSHWGTLPPAISTGDVNLSNTVLCADMVFFTGGATVGAQWDQALNGRHWVINHPQSRTVKDLNPASADVQQAMLPDFQNILYGDGRVASKGAADYADPLNVTNNYSMILENQSNYGGYLYWGEKEATPPPDADSGPTTGVGGSGPPPGQTPPVPPPPGMLPPPPYTPPRVVPLTPRAFGGGT